MWLTTVYFSYIKHFSFYGSYFGMNYLFYFFFFLILLRSWAKKWITTKRLLLIELLYFYFLIKFFIIKLSWRWNLFGYRNIINLSSFSLYGLIGGSFGYGLSLILRIELALPGFILCSSLQYYSIITFHGLFMIFFMIMPILIGGFGNFLIPLFLCSSDMIFPRLNACSLWLVFGSFILMCVAMYIEGGVNAGWTFYVPLSIINSSSVDLMFFITFSWIKFFIRID